jgi:hypothetical protein
MRRKSGRSIECSREERSRRGGSNGGRLGESVLRKSGAQSVARTQWLLLQDEEHGIDQFEVLGEVVQLQTSVMLRKALTNILTARLT